MCVCVLMIFIIVPNECLAIDSQNAFLNNFEEYYIYVFAQTVLLCLLFHSRQKFSNAYIFKFKKKIAKLIFKRGDGDANALSYQVLCRTIYYSRI